MSENLQFEEWDNEFVPEILLNNSLSEDEYRRNLLEVVALGLDPAPLDFSHKDRRGLWQRAEAHNDLLLARRSL